MKTDQNRIFLVTFLLFATVSCGGGSAAGGPAGAGRGGGMPAMAVDIGTLEQFIRGRGATEIDPTEKPVVQAVWYLLNYAF